MSQLRPFNVRSLFSPPSAPLLVCIIIKVAAIVSAFQFLIAIIGSEIQPSSGSRDQVYQVTYSWLGWVTCPWNTGVFAVALVARLRGPEGYYPCSLICALLGPLQGINITCKATEPLSVA